MVLTLLVHSLNIEDDLSCFYSFLDCCYLHTYLSNSILLKKENKLFFHIVICSSLRKNPAEYFLIQHLSLYIIRDECLCITKFSYPIRYAANSECWLQRPFNLSRSQTINGNLKLTAGSYSKKNIGAEVKVRMWL